MEGSEGKKAAQTGDLYDRLMGKVKPAVKGQKLASVSFVWMQGERDAKMGWGDLYEEALLGLHAQLAKDLGRNPKEMTFVIGRLSDFDPNNKKVSPLDQGAKGSNQGRQLEPQVLLGRYR